MANFLVNDTLNGLVNETRNNSVSIEPKLPQVPISQEREIDYTAVYVILIIGVIWVTLYLISFSKDLSWCLFCTLTGLFIPLFIWKGSKKLFNYCKNNCCTSKCCVDSNCTNVYNDNAEIENVGQRNCEKFVNSNV